MRVLLTGANGFLGHYLTGELLDKGFMVMATSKGECRIPFQERDNFQYASMDFTDPFIVHDLFQQFKPEAVIHAGAMSKVDECELHQWEAYRNNVEATITLLINAAETKSFFVFVSTDFIFDGEKGMYSEEDSPKPVNFYGKTKLEAEDAVREYEYDWAIARTILVYGKPVSAKENIISVVKNKLEKGEEYKVVDDQVRTPTYVEDLASGLVLILEKKAKGIYHLAGEDILTPYQMACMTADHLRLDSSLIKKVTAENFSQPAKRPLKTGLNIDKARKKLGYHPISFREGVSRAFS